MVRTETTAGPDGEAVRIGERQRMALVEPLPTKPA
jgi:hypothetical protein